MPVEVADRKPEGQMENRRPKRGPPIPWPSDAPKLPDNKAHQLEVDKLRDVIAGFRTQLDEIKTKTQDTSAKDERNRLFEEKKALIAKKVAVSAEAAELRKKRSEHEKMAREKRQEYRNNARQIKDLNRELGDVMTPETIEQKIKELEFKLVSGKVDGLRAEKEILSQIRQLKANRGKANEMMSILDKVTTGTASDEEYVVLAKKVHNQILLKDEEVKHIMEAIDAKSNEIDTSSQQSEQKKLYQERKEVQGKITETFEKIDNLKKEHNEKKDKYFAFKAEYDKKCDEERARQAAARREEREKREAEDKKRELEIAAIKRLNPYKEEISNCEVLINYLRGGAALMPEKKVEKKVEAFDPMAALKPGMQVLKKDDSEESWLMGSKKPMKKSAGNKPKEAKPTKGKQQPVDVAKQPKARKLTHTTQKIMMFDALRVRLPLNSDMVKDAIEQLTEKKAHFETFKKTEAQALAEEQAEREKAKAAEAEAAAKAAAQKAANEEGDDAAEE